MNHSAVILVCLGCLAYEAYSSPLEGISDEEIIHLGTFINKYHDIKGEAYALNSYTIFIENFGYDAEGPDTYFLAGTSEKPNCSGGKKGVVVPYDTENPDNNGKKYDYDDRSIPLLRSKYIDGPEIKSYENENITLILPLDYTIDDFKWLSVWCRDFCISFGHVNFFE
jgi:hypothetical protein